MRQALEGIRVLDLSRMLPGPFCSMMLGDLGAEVIKIEEVALGDPTRLSEPRVGAQSAVFSLVNRNKKSVAINLKTGEGRDLLLAIAATSDVVLEQFRPGVVDRLGIGYEAVSRVNSRAVYCSLTGFGQAGPYRSRSGHDVNYIALAGVLSLTTDEQGTPVIPGIQVADLSGALVAAFAITAALLARERSGHGQFIDVSMFGVMLSMLPIPAALQIAGQPVHPGARHTLSGARPFYNVYQTRDGRYMSLGALEPKFWENFCRKVGRDDLLPRQFDEGARREDLYEQLRQLFESRTFAEWIELMHDADACCEPVLSVEEALYHPQTRQYRSTPKDQTAADGLDRLAFGYDLSKTGPRVSRPAPALGEHTLELLAEIGVEDAECQELAERGIIRMVRPPARR